MTNPQTMSVNPSLIACETVAAIVVHLRSATDRVYLSGCSDRSVKTLCGQKIGWDTKLPINAATCKDCLALAKSLLTTTKA